MTELLRKWAKAEPERCGWNMADGYTVLLNGKRHRRLPHGDALLLAAVIEAVEVRGGEWVLRAGPNLWVAGVSRTADNDYWDGHGDSRESATHALLAAYVAALEAEAGQ